MLDLNEEFKKLTIMYVDDDEDILLSIRRPLQRRFKEIVTACNGEVGIELFKEKKPDIVISDIRMPVMDGLVMSRKIKELSPHTPIIVSSAFDDSQYFIEAIDIGVSQYVLKPIDIDKLIVAISHCVKNLVLERHIEDTNRELRIKNKTLTEYKNAVELGTIVSKSTPQRFIKDVNAEFCKISGYTKDELVGKSYAILHDQDYSKDLKKKIDYELENNHFFKGISKDLKKDGTPFYSNLTIVPILNENNEVEEYLNFRQDITELVNKIYIDPLTNQPNRTALLRDLEELSNPVTVVINIESFKDINDFYGNDVGDFLLIETTKLLDNFIKKSYKNAYVYKLSGDEFGIIFDGIHSKDYYYAELSKIEIELEKNVFKYNEYDLSINVTIGFCIGKDEALIKADMARAHAKSLKKDIIEYSEVSDMKKHYENNIFWMNKIKDSIKKDHIKPYFQPILNNKTKSIEKYECLMRIDDGKDVISPIQFLPIAYKSKLSYKLTRIMIQKSFEYFENRQCEFSINLTASEVLDKQTVEYLEDKIKEYKIADRLVIELIESEGINEYAEVENFIQYIKKLGVKVAIDDFGSGYSNFDHILKLSVDYIKIDGSIVKNIHIDNSSFIIAKTVVEFAKSLGVKTIAEFVHCQEVLDKVNDLNVDYSQGFYTGKPNSELIY